MFYASILQNMNSNVLIEFIPIGNFVKVTAIDPVTLIEVSIISDRNYPKELMKNNAIKKLKWKIEKSRS